MREVYAKIKDGNMPESRKQHLLSTFLKRYINHMTQQQSSSIDPITADLLSELIDAMPDNTPGMDGVRKGDLLQLSPKALEWLAAMNVAQRKLRSSAQPITSAG